MNLNKHVYYDCGDKPIFRLSKDRCQKFLLALIACNAKVHDSISFSFDKNGDLLPGIKPGQVDAAFRISMPAGNEELFNSYMGENLLTEPPTFQLN